jgi:zinc protease
VNAPIRTSLIVLALAGCAPKADPAPAGTPVAPVDRTVKPQPLTASTFALPIVTEGELSNGLRIVVVENHELPLIDLRLAFNVGGWTDPAGQEGLAEAAMDMLNEGAGDYDALGLSAALKSLASKLSTSAGKDSASLHADTLKKNLEPTLDLMATVLLDPTWPESEWERLQKQRIQAIATSKANPQNLARQIARTLAYGDAYLGVSATEETVGALTVEQMQAWAGQWLVPGRALLLVGGDTTLEEVLPLLEARFGSWTGETPLTVSAHPMVQPESTTVYLVDKPGAAQSVIYLQRFVGERTDPEFSALDLANRAWGGQFTARLNMNLREDKGYTYGARSSFGHGYAPSRWVASASVHTGVTRPALDEVFAELSAITADRPLTADEIEYARSGLIHGYPGRFEQPEALLREMETVWRYGLPDDWLGGYLDRVAAVDPAQAQAVFAERVATQPFQVLVVGDLATIREDVEDLGHPVVLLDTDGKPVQE